MRASVDSEAIEEAAARWYAKRNSGTWTDSDQAEFDVWLEASTAHRIQYIRIDTAWNHAARLKALGAGVPSGVIPTRGSWGDARFFEGLGRHPRTGRDLVPPTPDSAQRRRIAWPRIVRHSVVATALLAAAIGLYSYTAGVATGNRYSTPVGGLEAVSLKDGSQVTLNTDSQLHVEIRERERHIALNRGEAFFEVAKDPARPFVVEAGDKRIIAVGTKFSVRRDGDDIQVLVTEGKVRVETKANGSTEYYSSTQQPTPGTQHSVLLAAGAIAQTAKDEILVRPDAAEEVEKLLSWRIGYVSFDNVTLADAVAEFNRYTSRKIFIEDPSIAAIRVGGNFRSNNTEAFLSLIQSGFPITVEQRNDKIILKER